MCAIYLKHGDDLVEMVEEPYQAEDILQKLLADYPNLLSGDQDSDARKRWLLVEREIGISAAENSGSRWTADHLFLDEEGVPTLVEVKRSSDTRIRREVVGQLLDYAANASSFWAPEKIQTAFELRHGGAEEAEHALSEFLGDDADPEAFWERVGVNLSAGRLRLVFVADEIHSELRRVVEFLNEQMNRTEVLALEVRQYVEQGGTRQTLVPHLIGQTEAALAEKRSSAARKAWETRRRRSWTEDDVLAAIPEHQPPELAERMIRLYEFMRDAGARPSFGTGARPSVTMWLGEDQNPAKANPVSVSIYTGGVSINFSFVRERRSPNEMARLAELARRIPGASPYLEGIEEKGYGMHTGMRPEEVLASDEALETFERVVLEASRLGRERAE